VSLVTRWAELVTRLPPRWADAQALLELAAPSQADRATALLAPLQPVRPAQATLSFRVAADGSGPSPAQAERALGLLDREGIGGTLAFASTSAAPEPAAPAQPARSLAAQWQAALETLPGDWSDLLGEARLDSSDYLERAALAMSPINPRRDGDRLALQFRSARRAGYGASPEMVRRCLARCDEQGVVGSVHVLRALSDTRLVQTQGPVWAIGGRTV